MPLPYRQRYILLIRLLVYVFSVNAFTFIEADTDLWGHIKIGERIWQEGALPRTDPYSYTAQGLPWVHHTWLMKILFYLIYTHFDTTGLLIFKLLIGLSVVHVLSSLYFSKTDNLPVYILHFFLLAFVLSFGFMTRPQLITWLFTTFLIAFLYRYSDGDRRALIFMPALMLLWVNCHGGVIAGIGIFGLVTATIIIRDYFTGQNMDKGLILSFTLSCLALLVNPYGYHLFAFFKDSVLIEMDVTEWKSIPLFDSSFLSFKIMALLCLATFFFRGRKHPWEIALMCLAIYFGFKHQRHSVLAGILMTPYLPLQFARLIKPRKVGKVFITLPSLGRFALTAIMIAFIFFQAAFHVHKYQANNFKIQVDPLFFPVYAVQFMQENEINGNILAPFHWGFYLIWKRPDSRVFIDPRYTTVYPRKIIIYSDAFEFGHAGWRYVLKHFPHNIILSNKNNKDLAAEPGWTRIYQDGISEIYIKKTDPPGPIQQKFLNKELPYPDQPPSLEFP